MMRKTPQTSFGLESAKDDYWLIPSLPFVWSPLVQPTNGGHIPDSLPFELGVDYSTGCVIQKPNELVELALAHAYSKGSTLSGLMDEAGIGQQYANDFVSFIFRSLSTQNLSGLKVLEIGCGNGYLLKCLRDVGAEVVGIEPGEHGQVGAEKWGIPIVRDMFPTKKIQGQYDLVIAFAVLEHVQDPRAFLTLIKENLKPDGLILIAVPDEAPYIDSGDISTLFHEHWSFFDEATLSTTLTLAGFTKTLSGQSGFGGSLYFAGRKGGALRAPSPETVSNSIARSYRYLNEVRQNCDKFSAYCRAIIERKETLGIYVPGRAVNALAVANLTLRHVRFFDDNPSLTGTFFAGIDVPVECRAQLLARPTDNVLIMSRTFGRNLAEELERQLPAATNIKIIDDVLN